MLTFSNKADVAARVHRTLYALSKDPDQGTDGMKMLLLISGMLVETAFLFDNCEEALEGSFEKLADYLSCEPYRQDYSALSLPPSAIIDFDAEHGRALAREFFEEWLDCAYEFHDMLLFLTQQTFMRWETMGQTRSESFRLLVDCTYRAAAFELAAQELCDVVIEYKICRETWNTAETITGLAGLSGYKLALSQDGQNQCSWFLGHNFPDILDQTAYVMTQEATRLGVSPGPDWRFGLPANDCAIKPPLDLIHSLEPTCKGFFEAIHMIDPQDQSVAYAKAAGRMLAVASGGERPEIEPVIAKPLAMSAMTESYKGVCAEYEAAAL